MWPPGHFMPTLGLEYGAAPFGWVKGPSDVWQMECHHRQLAKATSYVCAIKVESKLVSGLTMTTMNMAGTNCPCYSAWLHDEADRLSIAMDNPPP